MDGDEIDLGAQAAATQTVAAAAAAGTAQVATDGALAVFHADDDTLVEKITAVENAIAVPGLGKAIHFMDSGNTYIFISDADNTVDANDQLIELTGFDSTGKALVQNGGDLFIA